IQALGDYLTFCTRRADNPFGLSRQPDGETDRFFPGDMGNSFQLLGRAWAAALIYRLTGERRALVFAEDHIDWLLGKNPLDLCLFEGKGALNPPRYHHRYNQIPGRERGAVPGTIPNGFVRDMGLADRPGFDLSRGGIVLRPVAPANPGWCTTCFIFLPPANFTSRCKSRRGSS